MNQTSPTPASASPNPTSSVTPGWWTSFLTAVQFLTRVPVTGAMSGTAEFYFAALRRGVVFFPLVGGLVGLTTASVACGLSLVTSSMVAAMVALAFEATLTGAFHEDAFADTWDALGGGWNRDQVLEIMKDSRLGTYGTIALVLGVGVRAVSIATIIDVHGIWIAAAAITAAATLARGFIVAMMATTQPIDHPGSQAKDVSGTQTVTVVIVSLVLSGWLWCPWLLWQPLHACVGVVAAVLVTVWFRRKIMRRVGGTTGDLLGCTAYLVQLTLLIAATVSTEMSS